MTIPVWLYPVVPLDLLFRYLFVRDTKRKTSQVMAVAESAQPSPTVRPRTKKGKRALEKREPKLVCAPK